MLSRSSSSAGDRLRRTKSTSSTHTSSSGHQRSHIAIDPFVTRQQAEVAALEAYHRAHQHAEPTCPPHRPAQPKLQRRQSQVTGKSEGGHLEDARLGRKRSTSRKENVRQVKPAQQYPQKTLSESSNGDETEVRRRYVVPPNPQNRVGHLDSSSLPSSTRHPRRSDMGYADGSPVPRHSSTLKQRSSTMQFSTSDAGHSDPYSSSIAHLSALGPSDDATIQSFQAPPALVVDAHVSGDMIAMARDKCLQDFYQHKLRERKSFLLAPIQRIRAMNTTKSSESNYDTKLPPFNYADELVPPPPLPSTMLISSITVPKARKFSDSLKGRFRKVFRKTSRVPSGVPAQHIEAKHLHFPASSPLPSPAMERHNDPFFTASDDACPSEANVKVSTASSRDSVGDQSTAKSRITSWTNSTVAGTCSSRYDSQLAGMIEENAPLRRSDSMSTLRKASSFFGRPLKNKLHRSSKAELQSSEESAGLYCALQERIKPSDPASPPSSENEASQSTTSALATLPSQQKANSSLSSKSRSRAPTIRTATPDAGSYKLDIPSPVAEVMSPEEAQPQMSHYAHSDSQHSESTPRSQLQRRPAMKASTPSKEQIARRIERSRNRWQSPLDEVSSPVRAKSKANVDDNPYELRSLSRTIAQPAVNNDLPHHAKLSEKSQSGRQNVLSPSVYSRRTDGETPQPDSPIHHGNMMVTITGREVRSYSISPAKRTHHEARPVQGSADWRKWLSEEMHGLDNAATPEHFALPKDALRSPGSGRIDAADTDCIADQDHARQPKPIYAPIESNTNAMDGKAGSLRHAQRINRSISVREISSTTMSGEPPTESLAEADGATKIVNRSSSRAVDRADKPKSAFDLRANYKNSNSDKAKPISIRRKSTKLPTNNYLLEDTTIQNISAGPYAFNQTASTQTPADANKENSPPTELNSLPLVSSSEWLAAGANKKREGRDSSGLQQQHPAMRSRSVSRFSPSRTTTIAPSSGGSPGQRMVTNWLEGRSSKESTPAFV